MDTKLQTFLVLCRTMNYRVTAEQMHLTQPAVTKQIQALENIYGTKLFTYDGKKLKKTDKCIILEKYAESLHYNYEQIKKALKDSEDIYVRIGATKTIGDYVLDEAVIKYLSSPNHNLSLVVDNTERLLYMLDLAELDFAVVEGRFDKKKYDFRLLKRESFIGICPKGHRFGGRKVAIEEIFPENIIVREHGSGTRDILERELSSLGCDLTSFNKSICISSFKLICELVLKGMGISFAYASVIAGMSGLDTFTVENFNHDHEFNIVYLKNTNAGEYAELFFAGESSRKKN